MKKPKPKTKKKPKLDSDWSFFMELNGCKGMWPAAYYMDGYHFWPCGNIDNKWCECELCADMAKSQHYLEKYG